MALKTCAYPIMNFEFVHRIHNGRISFLPYHIHIDKTGYMVHLKSCITLKLLHPIEFFLLSFLSGQIFRREIFPNEFNRKKEVFLNNKYFNLRFIFSFHKASQHRVLADYEDFDILYIYLGYHYILLRLLP